jgi:hypothetical protein
MSAGSLYLANNAGILSTTSGEGDRSELIVTATETVFLTTVGVIGAATLGSGAR